MKWFSLISKKLKYFQFWYEFKSYVQVRRFFCREFNVYARDGPQNNAIKRIVKHFEDKSTIRKSYKRNRERPATIIRTRQTSTRYAISPSTRYAISPSTRYAISPRSPLFVAFNARDPIHLPEKHLPEITFPRKTLGRNYIIPNIHFPERAFSRNYISLNIHLPEITFS